MNLIDLHAMLTDLSREPAIVILFGVLCAIGGLMAGYAARRRDRAWDEWEQQQGDTQAPMQASGWMPPQTPAIPTPELVAKALTRNMAGIDRRQAAPTRPRIRAGSIETGSGPVLKPSYDARRQSVSSQ